MFKLLIILITMIIITCVFAASQQNEFSLLSLDYIIKTLFTTRISMQTILIYIGIPVGLYVIYSLLTLPLNRIRNIGDVGYKFDGRQSKRQLINGVRQRRNIGQVPPVYPNGWFYILESRELKIKDSKMLNCLGKRSVHLFVMFVMVYPAYINF